MRKHVEEKMKKVIIFGSTGSVGRKALGVIQKSKGKFKIKGLCANKNIKVLYDQVKKFKPEFVCVKDKAAAANLQKKIGKSAKLFKGEEGLLKFASIKSDISLMAISGISCLKVLLKNIEHTKRVALANKESVVVAGPLVFAKAKRFKTQILPVDSEINALFQLIPEKEGFSKNSEFSKVYLTASGGALSRYKKKDLEGVSIKDVLTHPTWSMGKRITVDSATLVNKGFEVIEAHNFFGIGLDKIHVVIHKESAIHALAEFKDNSLLACIYPPDMKMPISYALYYPRRFNSGKNVNFKSKFSLSFKPIDYSKYPLFKMILDAAKRKDNSLVILNACDEVAIDYFLKKKIKFTDIHKALRYIFKNYPRRKIKKINDVFFWDNWAREETEQYLNKL